MRQLNYTNSERVLVRFSDKPPFILSNAEGLSSPLNVLTSQVNYAQDGVQVTGSRYDKRSISIEGVLVAEEGQELSELRRSMIALFHRDKAGTLSYEEGDKVYSLEVLVEQGPLFAESRQRHGKVPFTIQLLALSPYWVDESAYKGLVPLAKSEDLFEFPLEVTRDFYFARFVSGEIIKVSNDGDVPVGVELFLNCRGSVTAPRVYNVLTQEFIGLKGNWEGGDRFVFSTGFQQKKMIKQEGVQEVNVLFKRLEGSTFLQLAPGDNHLQLQAESGMENLEGHLRFKPLVLGV